LGRPIARAEAAPRYEVGARRDRRGGVDLEHGQRPDELDQLGRSVRIEQLRADGDPPGLVLRQLVRGHAASCTRISASQAETAAPIGALLLSECVPGTRTTVRFGPSGGMPNGSRSPWTTSVGTVTSSSSNSRLFVGSSPRPGGWTGKARQRTATALTS